MEPIQYLKVIRGRWLVIVLTLVVGLSAAWLTQGGTPKKPEREELGFRASAVILSSSTSRAPGFTNLDTLEKVVGLNEVVTRAAENIGFDGTPKALLARIQVTKDTKTGFLTLSATGRFAGETKGIVDGYSRTLVDFVAEQQREDFEKDTAAINEDLAAVEAKLEELNAKLEAGPSDSEEKRLSALHQAALREKQVLESELQQVTSTLSQGGSVKLIQPAVVEEVDSIGPSIPQGSLIRYLAGGIGGLLVGLFLTLGLERMRPRIRDAEAAERNFGVPLIAHVPRIPRKQRREAPVAVAQMPSSHVADAFRVLAAGLLRSPSPTMNLSAPANGVTEESVDNGNTRGARVLTIDKTSIDKGASRPQHSILITSAASGEGKTTVVANLASAFAEMGKKTVVLSCDLRNPEVHKLLQVENESGLVDALEAGKTPILSGRIVSSPLHESNINVLPSGPTPPNPAELLNSDEMRRVIDEACRQADVVLLDTPPILAAMDVATVVSDVDAVLVIARSGKTSVKVADSTSQMLTKLGAPFLGVVLNCSTDIVKPRSYYRGVLPHRRSSSSASTPRSEQSA